VTLWVLHESCIQATGEDIRSVVGKIQIFVKVMFSDELKAFRRLGFRHVCPSFCTPAPQY
ncbi:hypothetical protein AZE42_07133, partial [Rhizopogon vesiculosus]